MFASNSVTFKLKEFESPTDIHLPETLSKIPHPTGKISALVFLEESNSWKRHLKNISQ
jgi:hypothetical protein